MFWVRAFVYHSPLRTREPIEIRDYSGNPFAALSLIAAPAVLTNACSVLVMSTSNRLARTIDRARTLTTELEINEDGVAPAEENVVTEETRTESQIALEVLGLRELQQAEVRTILLMRALQLFYVALSGFASSAFLSIFGAVIVTSIPPAAAKAVEIIAAIIGVAAVAAVVSGAILLVRETRIAVAVLHEQAAHIKEKVRLRLQKQASN